MPRSARQQQRPQVMKAASLDELFAALRRAGYHVIGPTVTDGAIVLAELESAADLPYGWGVALEPGGYRLWERTDSAAFGHAAGPQSWKPFLHPPRSRLWTARRDGTGFEAAAEAGDAPRYAFLGVRPCDLRAIFIQDRVLGSGAHAGSQYASRRSRAFIVAVSCTEPDETCFCASMGTGPQAGPGYDLALTELTGSGRHEFLVDVGSPRGGEILAQVTHEPADDATIARARSAVTDAAGRMGRSMPADGLHELMAASHDAARWEDVASRCLTCGNCTMMCPTCFCTTVEDTGDLEGSNAERWERWDSCFDLDFSYLHGGSVRVSAKSRYRQWLTHKLGTWHDQFGSSGCVGCGRCIVWCPAGIDITEEVAALRAEAGADGPGTNASDGPGAVRHSPAKDRAEEK
ncbi:MAG: 4Fe-4S dicluster domain-containing protein [Micromonosporaceae bacterium]